MENLLSDYGHNERQFPYLQDEQSFPKNRENYLFPFLSQHQKSGIVHLTIFLYLRLDH